jgi:hypothetical protein
MTEYLSKMDPDELMGYLLGFLVVGGGLLCALIAILGYFWHAGRKTEIEAALKQDMLNRGMSAEQIRTVLDAGTKSSIKGACGSGPSA